MRRFQSILVVALLLPPWSSLAAPDQLEGCLFHENDLGQFLSISPPQKTLESANSYARGQCIMRISKGQGIKGDKCQQYYDPSGSIRQRLYEKLSAIGSGGDVCIERKSKASVCPQLEELISACVDFYAEIVIKDWYPKAVAADARRVQLAKEEKRKAEEEQRNREAAIKMEKDREEKTADARNLARKAKLTTLGLTENELIVWGAEKKVSGTNLPQDATSAFSTINLRIYETAKNLYKIGEFTPPPKSEYEKMAEYQQRISQLRARHEADVTEAKKRVASEKKIMLEKRLLSDLGTPVAVKQPSYNADKEAFDFIIGAGGPNYEINVTYAASVSAAPRIKAELLASTPYVVFAFKNSALVLRDVFLQNGEEIIPLKIVGSTNIPVQFTDSAALAWEQKLERDKEAAAAAARRREEARARAEAARPKSASEQYAARIAASPDPRCQIFGMNALNLGPDTYAGQVFLMKAEQAGCR